MKRHFLTAAAVLFLTSGCAALAPDWPSHEVPFDAVRPSSAAQLRIQYKKADGLPHGTAIARVHIGKDGRARNVAIVETSGHRNLDQSAMEVAWTAKYRPFIEHGSPVEVTTYVPITLN